MIVNGAIDELRQKAPMLKCKTHKKDSILYCKKDKEWLCIECIPDHTDHFDLMVKGSGEYIYSLVIKSREVVVT